MNALTLFDLREICPKTPDSVLSAFVDPLNAVFDEFEVNSPARRAAFIAQAAHETGGFRWMKEFASGEAYDDRKDLGNNKVDGYSQGEGARYKGRGIFQLTGEANYERAGTALFLDADWFRMTPNLAEQPEHACRIAGWYWHVNKLNALADAGDFLRITKRINGGTNGLDDRIAYHERAIEALA